MESTLDFTKEVKDLAKSYKKYVKVQKATNLKTIFFNLNSPYFNNKQEWENVCKDTPAYKHFCWDWSLHQAYKDGEIIPYTKWLQRLEQINDWEENNSYKFNSFIQTFIANETTLVPYLLIPIEILLGIIKNDKVRFENKKVEIEKKVGSVTKEILEHGVREINNYLELVQEIECDILDFQKKGAKFLILDGNNRCSQAWVPFFSGKKPLMPLHKADGKIRDINLAIASYDKNDEPIIEEKSLFPKDGCKNLPWSYNSQNFMNKEEHQLEREIFDEALVEIKLVTGGTIEDISVLIIAYNEGTSWTAFEKLCISGTYMSLLINNYCDQRGEGIALYNLSRTTAGFGGTSSLEKKGDLKAFAEVTGYLLNPASPTAVNVVYASSDEPNKATKLDEAFKTLTHISMMYKCQDAALSNTIIFSSNKGGKELAYRCMPSFMSMLMNVEHPGVKEFCNVWGVKYTESLKLYQINLDTLKEFQQFHIDKCSPYIKDEDGKKIINPDFEEVKHQVNKTKSGKPKKPKLPVAKNGTYAFSRDAAGGGGTKMEDRHREIAKFIDDNIERWHESGMIQYKGDRPTLSKEDQQVLKDKYKDVDFTKVDKGHYTAVNKLRSFKTLLEERANPLDTIQPEPRSYNRSTQDRVEK